MPIAPFIPAATSEIAMGIRYGPPSGGPLMVIRPDIACATRSNPPLELYGPVWPKPEMEQYISDGLSSAIVSYPMPIRSATPGRKFSISTSAVLTSSFAILRSSGFFRSSSIDRLLRFQSMNGAPSPLTCGGLCLRSSPFPGRSTLITSAP